MLCPSCHTENRENARFCKGCGRSLVAEQQLTESAEPTAPATSSAPATTAEASQPQTAPMTPAAPAQVAEQAEPVAAHEPAATNGYNVPVDDISLAPTQILTPAEMVAYHTRRWQQDAENEAGDAEDVGDAENEVEDAGDTGDAEVETTENGIADQPTITVAADAINASSISDEPSPVEPDEPPSVEPDASPSVGADLSRPAVESQPTAEGEDVSASPSLDVGATVNGRYEVVQVVSNDEHEHVYQVVDRQGYQRCWNCGSEQNAEGDEFCIDCGAELLNIEYTMHEYDATGTTSTNDDAHVLLGQIVNTFVEQGRTYVIEQPHISQPLFSNGVHLLSATDSDAGMLRRGDPNEDSTLVLQLQRIHESIATPVGVFIVADGMGGHDDGQGASRMTINVIAERITRALLMEPLETEKAGGQAKELTEDDLIDTFKGAIQDANLALCQDNQRHKTDKGSTVTGFMLVGEHAYIINVGDSRTYMLRDGKLYQLTNDHSLVSQLVASGLIEPDDIYTHPQRSQIFRSLGDKPNVQVDDFKQQLHPGDILLSCCDGLWEMIRNPQITEILANAPDPQTACTQLIDAANTNGGEDNISAVVVFVRG